MAVVATSEGRVILKNGKVSCSCCVEQDCCMYAAQALADGLYTSADLPDSVFISSSGSSGNFQEATRNGVNFVIENGFAAGEDVVLGLNGDTWGLWVDAGAGPEFIIGDYNGACLINWPYSEVDRSPAIQDNFEDTYTVEVFDAFNALVYGDTYVRESLCVWVGSKENSALVFSDEPTQSFPFGWSASLFESGGFKSGFQNTPVGEYPMTTGQFAGGKLVISV